MPAKTWGFKIAAYYRRVTFHYYNEEQELTATEVFIPKKELPASERRQRIEARIALTRKLFTEFGTVPSVKASDFEMQLNTPMDV